MKITVVGSGYVGLVTGTCLAEVGNDVICVDIDAQKIEKMQQGIIPIYEPELDDLVSRNLKEGRLHFTTDLTAVLDNVDVVFSAVGTPPDEDGSADLTYVLEVARTVGKNMTKSITLKIPLHKITDQLMYQLEQLCIKSEGPHLFKLKIVDDGDEYGVDLISSNIKVNADYQFIKELDYMYISYKIN